MAEDDKSIKRIEQTELRELLGRGEKVVIIDVRSAGEFAEGHIDGAVNIPIEQLQARTQELPTDGPVVTVCARGGARSANAAVQLRDSGIEHVRQLCGGTLGWFDASKTTAREE